MKTSTVQEKAPLVLLALLVIATKIGRDRGEEEPTHQACWNQFRVRVQMTTSRVQVQAPLVLVLLALLVQMAPLELPTSLVLLVPPVLLELRVLVGRYQEQRAARLSRLRARA